MSTVRLTMTQALARSLAAQRTVIDGKETPIVAGVWAIFGHGNEEQPPGEPGVRRCRCGGRRLPQGLGAVRRRPGPHRLHHASRVGNRPRPRPNQP